MVYNDMTQKREKPSPRNGKKKTRQEIAIRGRGFHAEAAPEVPAAVSGDGRAGREGTGRCKRGAVQLPERGSEKGWKASARRLCTII
jgi:hypothetical protein